MNPNSQVADLIMQLMSRGRSGGMPMQASPELVQYLAHAQAGSVPARIGARPSASVVPGPGAPVDMMAQPAGVDPAIMAELSNPNFLNEGQPSAMDMIEANPRPPAGTAMPAGNAGEIYIWYTNPKTGKRLRLDGPFTDDIQAARAMRELRAEGVTDELEISPY